MAKKVKNVIVLVVRLNQIYSIERYSVLGVNLTARTILVKIVLGPYRLTVRTEPSQGLNRGSIPRRVTPRGNIFNGSLVLF